MARQVRVEILADARKFTRGMQDAEKSAQKFTDHTNRAGKALKAAVGAFSVGVVVSQMRGWVAAARDSNKTAAQTAAVLKSTHGAAGLTADQFAKLASQISKTSAVDDDLIQSGENIIATFTRIHGDVFRKTTQAAVDMTAAMNHGEVTQQGLQASSILLGKALNDPLKGLSALTRVGVTFSAQQREQIQDLIKHGQTAKAQGVILAEVNKEFGGSAKAAVTPAKQLAVTWGNMQEVLGNLLIPALDKGATILAGLLGVVDRNRTAFGILFGILGTGAAVVGTLIVAQKIHAAVTDSIKVATTAWGVAQKGLNLILGTTRAQAVATTIAQEGLAASTAAAGSAATGASAAMGTGGLAGSTDDFVRQGVAAIPVLGALAGVFVSSMKAAKDHVSVIDEWRHSLGFGVDKLDKAKIAADKTAAAQAKLAIDAQAAGVAEKDLAGKTDEQAAAVVNAAARIKDLSGKLAELKGQFAQARDSMAQTIESYQGLISKSKTTASEVIKDIHNQVANFRTYSADTQRLIKAGVDPAAIRELSEKGPEYVHGLARGTAKQLADYKKAWHDRQAEVKGDFTRSMQAQLQDLVRKMRAMQKEIDKLRGKTVDVTASTKVDPNVLKVFTAAGGKVRFMAQGGRIMAGSGPTADDVPILASKGETVVSADHSRQLAGAFAAVGVPGYAKGGAVYGAELGMRNRASALMVGSASRAAKLYQQLAGFGSAGGGNLGAWIAAALAITHTSATWGAAIRRRIMFESGGNPNAINLTDSNALAGHPSQGLMQTIPSTFFGFHQPGTSFSITDPVANIAAAIRYIKSRYGTIFAIDPPVRGYDRGGWLPPGLSMAYNGTGRPEPVGRGGDINVHFNAPVYGDKRALAQVVRDAVRSAQRHDGIPAAQQLR